MAGRRGNNEGTIRKRDDGRWEGRVLRENGKYKCYYGKTRQEVARLVNQALRDKEHGLPLMDDRQTVGQYLLSWLDVTKHHVEQSTFRRYSNYVQLHIIPAIGKIPLSKLTAQQVQTMYAKLLGKGLSSTSVHHVHGTLHKAMVDAMRLDLVQRNVTDLVRAPRRNDKEMKPLNEEQVRAFLAGVVGDPFEALYVLALSTGMREGEIFSLRWQDVDLDKSRLYVLTTIKEGEHSAFIGRTKTKASKRRILIPQWTVEKLRIHRERQELEKIRLGEVWDDSLDLVFPNTVGGKMIPDNFVKRQFKHKLRAVGLSEDFRFHDLRHTFATLMLSQGVNVKVVSEMLGHADITITLRVYAHVLPTMQQIAASEIDSIIDGWF